MNWATFGDTEDEIKVKTPPIIHGGKSDWNLATDVFEENGNVILKLNLPGIDPQAVDIAVSNDMVKVSGESREESETEGKRYFMKEIRRGAFERTIKLPIRVDMEKAEADYKNGVLKIVMPKKEEHTVNKIRVRTE